MLKTCPITAGMGVLGKKWTLLIMRDIMVYDLHRFGEFQRSSGLSPRMLSKRLQEMTDEGLVQKSGDGKETRYDATPRGLAIAPILDAIIEFGILHRADEVFEDGTPRSMAQFRRDMEARGIRFWSLAERAVAPLSVS